MNTKILKYPQDEKTISKIVGISTLCFERIMSEYLKDGSIVVTLQDKTYLNDLPLRVRKVLKRDDFMEFEFSLSFEKERKQTDAHLQTDVHLEFYKNGKFHCQFNSTKNNIKSNEDYIINFNDSFSCQKNDKKYSKYTTNVYKALWNMYIDLAYTGYFNRAIEENEEMKTIFTNKEFTECNFNLGFFDASTE